MEPVTIGLGLAALWALTHKKKDVPAVSDNSTTHQDSGKGRPPLDGIDTSDHGANGADWNSYRSQGGLFCIHRCSDGLYKDGSGTQAHPEDYRRTGYRKALANVPQSVTWGAYHFWRTFYDQRRQIETARAVIGNDYGPGNLPFAVDVEGGSFSQGPTGPQERFNLFMQFCEMAEREFGAFMLYSSARVLRTYFPGIRWPEFFTRRFLWLTPYWNPPPPVPGDWVDGRNWVIHQFRGTHRYGIPIKGSGGTPPAVPAVEPLVEPVKSFPATDLNTWHWLNEGDTSELVKMYQRHLGMADITGVYDADTIDNVKAYQIACGLEATGIIDPRTFSYLAWEAY